MGKGGVGTAGSGDDGGVMGDQRRRMRSDPPTKEKRKKVCACGNKKKIKKVVKKGKNFGRRFYICPKDSEEACKGSVVWINEEKKTRRSNVYKEIRRYQKSFNLLAPRKPIERLISHLLQRVSEEAGTGTRPQRMKMEAKAALHEASEAVITTMFEDANRAACHAKRVTVMPKDIQFLKLVGAVFRRQDGSVW